MFGFHGVGTPDAPGPGPCCSRRRQESLGCGKCIQMQLSRCVLYDNMILYVYNICVLLTLALTNSCGILSVCCSYDFLWLENRVPKLYQLTHTFVILFLPWSILLNQSQPYCLAGANFLHEAPGSPRQDHVKGFMMVQLSILHLHWSSPLSAWPTKRYCSCLR